MDLLHYLAGLRTWRNPALAVTVTRLINKRPHPQPLWIEPWGATIEMMAQSAYDVVAARSEDDQARATYDTGSGDWITVEADDTSLTVWAPTATTHFALFHKGDAIWVAQ